MAERIKRSKELKRHIINDPTKYQCLPVCLTIAFSLLGVTDWDLDTAVSVLGTDERGTDSRRVPWGSSRLAISAELSIYRCYLTNVYLLRQHLAAKRIPIVSCSEPEGDGEVGHYVVVHRISPKLHQVTIINPAPITRVERVKRSEFEASWHDGGYERFAYVVERHD